MHPLRSRSIKRGPRYGDLVEVDVGDSLPIHDYRLLAYDFGYLDIYIEET
jgi:hypothetical protein